MKLSKALKAFAEEASKSDSYWVERAKLDFSVGLEKQRRAAKMTYASIAQKLGTSAAYITKVFRGDSNMTIESMVKLARATGGHLDIQVVDSASEVARWDISHVPHRPKQMAATTAPSATIISIADYAANHDVYDWGKVAA